MKSHRSTNMQSRTGFASAAVAALCSALLASCGGGGDLVAADATSISQPQREQLALNRAMQANVNALGTHVKAERAPGQRDTSP